MTETTEIEVRPDIHLGIIPARTPHDVIIQATSIAKELAKIIKDNRLSNNIQGREFVRVEGWSTMGAMLGVLPREVTELTRRFDDGSYEATVELIRISDNAVIGRASAFVGMDEKDRQGRLTWGSRAEYARRSMAVTRATGKAYRLGFSWIMALAGYEPTPAEEMPDTIEGEYAPAPPPAKKGNGDTPLVRPLAPEVLADFIDKKAKRHTGNTCSPAQRSLVAILLDQIFGGDKDKRHAVQSYLLGAPSLNEAADEMVLAALDWLKPTQDTGGAYMPDQMAEREAQAVYTASLKSEGQAPLL